MSGNERIRRATGGAAAPALEPTQAPDPRTPLRAVPDNYVPKRVRVRRRRRLVAGLGVVASLIVFGVAAAHAALVTSQMRLQRLDDQVAEQQARYQRLRLDVARLESPERIVAAAQERLGMVPPPGVTYLSPSGPAADPAAASAAAAADGDVPGNPADPNARSWATLKPYLGPIEP